MILFTLPWKGRDQAPSKKPAKDVFRNSRGFCCPRRKDGGVSEAVVILKILSLSALEDVSPSLLMGYSRASFQPP